MSFPQRIICMTEESVELLYLLGKQDLIAGVSTYVRRPAQARKLPTISAFTHANIKKIEAANPDLILGFSDIQKDIAKELIGLGHNVFISNQRSLDEILNYILMLGRLVDAKEKSHQLVESYKKRMKSIKKINKPLKVYLEEWDEPLISAIQWFSELFELFGVENIFSKQAKGSLAQDRFITHQQIIQANPDVIFPCWCGKKVDIDSIKNRDGYQNIKAIKENKIFELEPEIFLQPGPALFESGLDVIEDYLTKLGAY